MSDILNDIFCDNMLSLMQSSHIFGHMLMFPVCDWLSCKICLKICAEFISEDILSQNMPFNMSDTHSGNPILHP